MTARRPYRKPTVRSVPRPPATDRELVERTLSGDRAAWAELYVRFRRLVARELGRILWRAKRRRREDLDEALQEWWACGWLEALRAWDPTIAGLSTYLTIRAHGWGTNHLKRLRPGYGGPGLKSTRDPLRIAAARAESAPTFAPRPDQVLEEAELRARVRSAALSCAPTLRDRAIVQRLLDVAEPTAQDLADVLGISRQRVQQLEARLLERIRPLLAPLAA